MDEHERTLATLAPDRRRAMRDEQHSGDHLYSSRAGARGVALAGGEAPELLAAVADDRCPVGEQEMIELNLRGEPCEAVA
jgi:hypothetical protein